ncbi:MAG: 2-hydroxyacid dehydrogenase [Clostridia bacterium]|nr:2-hydroxyacid dehydrogenase [Clostridia bacterium]
MYKFAFFDARPYDRPGFDLYGRKNCIVFKYLETKLDIDTVELARGCDGICVFVNDDLNAQVIEKLYEYGIKIIALRCAGFNNVDVKAAYKKIHILRVPAYSPYAVAEHAIAMLLTSIRRIHKAYNRTREFNFSLNGFTGFDLHGKTMGVIGTGKIGKIFIDICRGFRMNVIAYDLYPDNASDINYVELDELFGKSDIISLHCPLTNETDHIINRESLAKMKKGVVLINTSRGGLIETEALIDAIKAKTVSAACLDVYEEESDIFFEDNSGHIMQDDNLARLLSMPNVLITSHQAYLTEDALDNIAQVTTQNISDFFEGRELKNEICYHCDKIPQCQKQRVGRCF